MRNEEIVLFMPWQSICLIHPAGKPRNEACMVNTRRETEGTKDEDISQ
jgi:hypothetical protein